MRNHAFIVTKPLQILIVLSLIKQLNVGSAAHLLIVDYFSKAESVYERMTSLDWEFSDVSMAFCNSMKDAYRFVRRHEIDVLFIDGDVGIRRYVDFARIKLRHSTIKINVYEEGVGTYRTDLYSGLKRKVFSAIGAGTHFGGCKATDAVYVLDTDVYRGKFIGHSKSLIGIDRTPIDIVRSLFSELSYAFGYNSISIEYKAVCHVYLSRWVFDNEFLKRFRDLPGDKYIKPHPHIKCPTASGPEVLIEAAPPAEMVLVELLDRYRQVNVYHHGTSVSRYISNPNIRFFAITDSERT